MGIALLGHGSQYRDGSSSDDLTLNYTSHDGVYRKMIVIITTVAVTADMMISGVKYNDVSLVLGFKWIPQPRIKTCRFSIWKTLVFQLPEPMTWLLM